jgi:ATP/maltotriose-dependent transcriptional regulator MalT
MAFAIWEIWWNDMGFFALLLRALPVFLVLSPVSFWIAWDFIVLNVILNVNCDPVTYVQVMHLLGQARNSRRSAITIQINEAVGNMWTGRFSEALALVKSLPGLNAGDQLSVLYIRFNCCMKLKDIGGALQARQETEALISTAKQSSLHKRGEQLLDMMASSFALEQGDYASFRHMEETGKHKSTMNIQQVTTAFHLAKADMAQGDTQSAKARLEYVVKMGGTLYVTEDAKSLLAELKENPHGSGQDQP